MTKIIDATCATNIVKIGGLPVTPCTILSEGVGASNGVVILDGDKAVYVPKTTADLKTVIEKLSLVLTQVTSCFTTLDAIPPISGACATYTAAILALQTQLEALKAVLK